MSTFDVRNMSEEAVTEIKFADPDVDYYVGLKLKNFGKYIDLYDEGNHTMRIAKSDIDNLIKALKVSKEKWDN